MTNPQENTADLRQQILSDPNAILDDRDLMRALIAADSEDMGNNVIDLRGAALTRLEARLSQLEENHRTVIATAYDNLASTNQIQRAVLLLLEPTDFAGFLNLIATELCVTLRVDSLRLCLETNSEPTDEFGHGLVLLSPGTVEKYVTLGRNVPDRIVTLRPINHRTERIYGPETEEIQSEALLQLDLGDGNLPGLLALGSQDEGMFDPAKGTDLLAFFGAAFERAMRRWLA